MSAFTTSPTHPTAAEVEKPFVSSGPDGFDLIDILVPLLQTKREIAMVTAFAFLAGLAISLLLRPVFTATAVIMPPQQEQSAASALIGQLGSAGSLGAASALGLKNPADMYVGILQSRLIADSLVDQFHLQSVYGQKLRSQARSVLRNNADFEAAKDNLIYIRVKDHDPARAAALANGFVDQLHQLNSRIAIGEAAQRQSFFDGQLAAERKSLADAEDALRTTEEKTGMIQLNGQAEMTIRNIAAARAEIANREVKLGLMRTFATDQNPEVARQEREIGLLKAQLTELEDSQARMTPGDLQMAAGRVPAAGLEYMRRLREVRYHESLSELLAKQAEAATLDAAKAAPLIQVVDPAEVPERRSGPSRALVTLGFALTGFAAASLWSMMRQALRSVQNSPIHAPRLELLREAVRIRKG